MKSLSRRSVAIVPAVAEPPPWERCPAKSDPFKTIRRHALECGGVFEALRTDFFRAPEELIPPAALLFALGHDAGKISPGFLWKIAAEFARRNGVPKTVEYQRHEVISEAAFFEFLNHRSDRSETIVGWHHGRRNPAPLREGAADYGGEAWQMRRREFLQWASGYASTLPEKLSPESQLFIAGALCLADWIASDEHHFAEDRSARPFEELIADADKVLGEIGFSRPEFRPGMRFEEIFPPYSPNQAQIALAEQAVAPGIFLQETTMGSGKTEAALYAAYRLIATGVNRGFFFALPTRLTSNKIHERVNAFLARVSLSGKARLIHGTAWLEPAGGGELGAGESWFAPAKRAILEPFGVGTVDQVLKGVLNVKHFFLRLAGLAGKVVIIDEVHAFDEYMYMPSEPHGEGGISRRALEKIRARRKMMPSGGHHSPTAFIFLVNSHSKKSLFLFTMGLAGRILLFTDIPAADCPNVPHRNADVSERIGSNAMPSLPPPSAAR